MRKIQIGIIGSMADIKLEESLKKTARVLGKEIAKSGAVLAFGFEGDYESLSLIAAQEADKRTGQTLAFCWGDEKPNLSDLNSIVISTGQLRGGGREFSFILSCDAIISMCGGSGTLMEIAMAYQANIPLIVIKKTGGWSDKLKGSFLDNRKRMKVIAVRAPKEAVKIALSMAKYNYESE